MPAKRQRKPVAAEPESSDEDVGEMLGIGEDNDGSEGQSEDSGEFVDEDDDEEDLSEDEELRREFLAGKLTGTARIPREKKEYMNNEVCDGVSGKGVV